MFRIYAVVNDGGDSLPYTWSFSNIRGIYKINIATELRIACTSEIQNVLQSNPGIFDPRVYGKSARNRVKQIVIAKLQILGSSGQGGI